LGDALLESETSFIEKGQSARGNPPLSLLARGLLVAGRESALIY
jgi:hypothetical protein